MRMFCQRRVDGEEAADREALAEHLLQEILNCLSAGDYSAAGVVCGLILNVLDFSRGEVAE